jgi:hypothetical protein
MPRKPRPHLSSQLALPLATSAQLGPLLSTLAQRLGRWTWVDVWMRVQRGEPVPAFHKGLMRATLARLSGRGPRPEVSDD